MDTPRDPINERIAAQVRALRASQGLSLEALAARSGVSRSALSLIERAQSSATAVVLDKLAAGLGVTLSSLFDPLQAAAPAAPLVRAAHQTVWTDPATGYTRRNVSPPGFASPMRIVEVHFPAGAQITYDNNAREQSVHQQVWVLEGAISVSNGANAHRLQAGDCLAMTLDEPSRFHNPTRKPARYAVVLVADAASRR